MKPPHLDLRTLERAKISPVIRAEAALLYIVFDPVELQTRPRQFPRAFIFFDQAMVLQLNASSSQFLLACMQYGSRVCKPLSFFLKLADNPFLFRDLRFKPGYLPAPAAFQ